MTMQEPLSPAWRGLAASLLLACAPGVSEALDTPAAQLAEGIEQLRHVAGRWNVTTTQYRGDGRIAQRTDGTCQFDWVVPDRVLSGRASTTANSQSSGMLLYVNERRATLEMVAVGGDGTPWVSTGPAGGDVRTTPPMPMSDGTRMQLRYTRFNVTPNRFESRMEISTDGGASWRAGNHQLYVRAMPAGGTSAGGMSYRKRPQPYIPLT